MSSNAIGQSDCRILKLTIALEQNNEKAFFMCMLIQIHGN